MGKRAKVWLLGAACLLIGCGGQVEAAHDGGEPAQVDEAGGGSSSDFYPCPAKPPSVGGKCLSPANQGCAYPVLDGACQAFVCDGASGWQSAPEGC